MGTQGVPLDIPKSVIIDSIKKRKGVVTYVCKDLDICHDTALKYINADPELKQLLADQRHSYDEYLCDKSESVLVYALNRCETDLSNALGSAKYILNNKGKSRGYALKPDASTQPDSEDKVLAAVREMEASSRNEAAGGPSLEDQPPILD
jgi:hypothetical protein